MYIATYVGDMQHGYHCQLEFIHVTYVERKFFISISLQLSSLKFNISYNFQMNTNSLKFLLLAKALYAGDDQITAAYFSLLHR